MTSPQLFAGLDDRVYCALACGHFIAATGAKGECLHVRCVQGPYALKGRSVSALLASLKTTLPPHMKVTVKEVTLKKDGKTPSIQIRDGLWRGASLIILDTGPLR